MASRRISLLKINLPSSVRALRLCALRSYRSAIRAGVRLALAHRRDEIPTLSLYWRWLSANCFFYCDAEIPSTPRLYPLTRFSVSFFRPPSPVFKVHRCPLLKSLTLYFTIILYASCNRVVCNVGRTLFLFLSLGQRVLRDFLSFSLEGKKIICWNGFRMYRVESHLNLMHPTYCKSISSWCWNEIQLELWNVYTYR